MSWQYCCFMWRSVGRLDPDTNWHIWGVCSLRHRWPACVRSTSDLWNTYATEVSSVVTIVIVSHKSDLCFDCDGRGKILACSKAGSQGVVCRVPRDFQPLSFDDSNRICQYMSWICSVTSPISMSQLCSEALLHGQSREHANSTNDLSIPPITSSLSARCNSHSVQLRLNTEWVLAFDQRISQQMVCLRLLDMQYICCENCKLTHAQLTSVQWENSHWGK